MSRTGLWRRRQHKMDWAGHRPAHDPCGLVLVRHCCLEVQARKLKVFFDSTSGSDVAFDM